MADSILFVCTGNICRSPTADGVMRQLVVDAGLGMQVDSAGTHSYHVGEPPDRRSQQAAKARGYDLSSLRARKFCREDFDRFDTILAMDGGHLHAMELMKPKHYAGTLALFMDHAGLGKLDVPDPYYGDIQDFEHCLDMVERGVKAFLTQNS